MKTQIRQLTCYTAVIVTFLLAGPLPAAPVLDDPLQGSTIAPATGGARQGGTFVSGGWRVDHPYDCIYWHVPTSSQGAFEYDVTNIGSSCSTKNELSHMYDWTFGNSDVNYGGGYRDGPHKHFIRRECGAKAGMLELVWNAQCPPGSPVEADTAALGWDASTTYRFRVEWESIGGNAVLRTYRNGVLVLTQACAGQWNPGGHSVRIAASNRHAGEDAYVGAIYSNVRVYDNLGVDPPGAPTMVKPTNGQTVNTALPVIEWTGAPHSEYQVRINTQNNAEADALWDSFDAVSGKNYCTTGPLPDNTTYYAFARLANAAGYGPWSAGRQFAVNTASVVPNIVQVTGDSLTDRNGPFLGLGATYFSGLRFYHNGVNGNAADWAKLNGELALLRDGDFKYVRILTMVSWPGKEIAPVSFGSVAAWPNYWNEFQGFLDLVASYGLRTEITIFAGAQDCMPNTATRQQHVATMLQKIAGREDKIIQIEMANESWANGFSEPPVELCGYANTVRAGTTLPISLSCPSDRSDASIAAFYGGCPAANIATVHFHRGSEEDGWFSVRDCYRTGLTGVPPVSSNEPVGPGSSVYDERDPIRLVMAAAFAWGANLPMYVWHTRAGVYGEDEKPGCSTLPTTCKLGDEAAIHDFVHLDEILPPDFSNWVRNDGREASAPFTAYCMGQANKWWPEVGGATNGVVRNTGSIKGGEFITLPIGVLGGGVELEARQPVSFEVYNPLTGEIVASMTKNTGERFTLPQGPRAYIIKGILTDLVSQTTETSIDLGSPDVLKCMTHVPVGDGDTTPVTIGGRSCRQNVNQAEDFYFYFSVCDSFAYQASRPDLYITLEYFDTGAGALTLQYDSNTGSDIPACYKPGGTIPLTGTNTWKHATLHVTDAYFGNRQNGGADFRFGNVGNVIYLDTVRVSTQQPAPPMIAKVPPLPCPDTVVVGTHYACQLMLTQGSPAPTWTVLQGPPGLTVSATGLVSWTPGIGDLGDNTIVIQAANLEGSDTITYVVRVISRNDSDLDGDVDQTDFGLFQRCFSGFGIAAGQGCGPADMDSDGDVDEDDFSLFLPCMAGAARPPGC